MLLSSYSIADDIGITKARLIQQNDSTYILEADINQRLVSAFKPPIFPERFKVSELDYVNQSGWIIAQWVIVNSGAPLSPEEVILLPWAGNGANLAVQWLDRSVHQGLFLRSPEGIRIPLDLIMDSHHTLWEVCRQHFGAGLDHFSFKTIHWLLIISLLLAFTARSSFRMLLGLSFGHGLSMILAELEVPGFDLLMVDILWILVILLLSRTAFDKERNCSFFYIFIVMGPLHGIAYFQEIRVLEMNPDQRLAALFSFNLALDLCSFGLAGLLGLLSYLLPIAKVKKVGAYASGTLAVALIVILFQDNVLNGKNDILEIRPIQNVALFELPANLNPQGGQRPVGAQEMTGAIMPYLTVEPYEVRQEILIKARTAVQLLGIQDDRKVPAPVESLEPIKARVLQMTLDSTSVSINGQSVAPTSTRVDFVTLGVAGVVVVDSALVESLDQGTIGLTLVYSTKDLANKIQVRWNLFPPDGETVEARTVDPFGGSTTVLSPASNKWTWEARVAGHTVPVVA